LRPLCRSTHCRLAFASDLGLSPERHEEPKDFRIAAIFGNSHHFATGQDNGVTDISLSTP
jgi:hypothetical protein